MSSSSLKGSIRAKVSPTQSNKTKKTPKAIDFIPNPDIVGPRPGTRDPKKMHYLFYKVNRSDIYLIKFILESYENMVQVSTINKKTGKIQLTVAPDFLPDVKEIIRDLQKRHPMQRLDEDPTKSQGRY